MMHYFDRTRQILVVGDDSGQAGGLVVKLRDLGLECARARNAAEAFILLELAILNGVTPGLIVVEAVLAEGSGNEFVRLVRQNPQLETVPIIVAATAPKEVAANAHENPYLHAKSDGLIESISGMLALNSGSMAPASSQGLKACTNQTGQIDILVAEDNDINQLVLAQFLDTTPWTFAMVGNGRRAVHAFRNFNPRLILMDISMPEMSGREATGAIRALERDTSHRVPIIALTAHALKGDRDACLSAGMDDYMAKPVNFGDLQKLLESHLGNASARSAA